MQNRFQHVVIFSQKVNQYLEINIVCVLGRGVKLLELPSQSPDFNPDEGDAGEGS